MRPITNAQLWWAGTGVVYGTVRKTLMLDGARTDCGHVYNDKLHRNVHHSRPVLFSEIAGIVVFHSIINAYVFPIYVYKDVVKLEARARGVEFGLPSMPSLPVLPANVTLEAAPHLFQYLFD